MFRQTNVKRTNPQTQARQQNDQMVESAGRRSLPKSVASLARFSVMASQIWETIPMKIKCLAFNSFKKEYKLFLLESQAC